jgi:two-component sensor histidine kinase
VYEWQSDADAISLLAEYGAAEYSGAEYGAAEYSGAEYGAAEYGGAEYGAAEYGGAGDSVGEYSAAEYSGASDGGESGAVVRSLSAFPFQRSIVLERSVRQIAVGQTGINATERAYMAQRQAKALLMLPMVFQDRVVGLVEIVQAHEERVFSDQEISLAQILANQTAVAVENARLYERAQTEIVERTRAEQELQASLEEKVVLLKEIHHRVKNNLQVISSLLNLQSQTIEDDDTLATLRDSQNRIRSMALIHERLYRSRDLSRIDLGEYVQSLSSFLIRSYRAYTRAVQLRVDADDVALSIDAAVPCGLIINELMSNALKHAFPDGREGEIRVAIKADNGLVQLSVGDNGVGFPDDVDFRETESLGLQLVNTLVDQLDGTVALRVNGGTTFEIAFAQS